MKNKIKTQCPVTLLSLHSLKTQSKVQMKNKAMKKPLFCSPSSDFEGSGVEKHSMQSS